MYSKFRFIFSRLSVWFSQLFLRHPAGLQASLLVFHNEETYVNLDPQLTQVVRETECMMKLELEIPEAARLMLMKRDMLKSTADDLRVSGCSNGGSKLCG